MTTPQPLPPDPETQQQTETQHEAEAVAAIAALLAAASAAGATYMSGQVAQAGIVNTLRGLGLTRKQAGKLVELDAARPSPPVIPLQPSTRQVFRDGPTYRAHYLVNAAKRIVNAAAPGGQSLGDAVDAERRYFNQHRTAQVQREQAAARIDAAANSYGQLLGWHAVLDDRTTPECREADGKNFYADHPPAIGLPGLKHAGNCRCYPGPPHEGAPLVDPTTAPRDEIAASREDTMAIALAADTRPSSSQPYTLLLFWDLTPIGLTALSVDGLGALEFTRHVRTEAGVRRYHLPIGAPIGGRGKGDPLSKLVVKVGNRNAMLRRNADGSVERRNGDRKTWRPATADEAKLLGAAEKGHKQRHAEVMASLKDAKPKPARPKAKPAEAPKAEDGHVQAHYQESAVRDALGTPDAPSVDQVAKASQAASANGRGAFLTRADDGTWHTTDEQQVGKPTVAVAPNGAAFTAGKGGAKRLIPANPNAKPPKPAEPAKYKTPAERGLYGQAARSTKTVTEAGYSPGPNDPPADEVAGALKSALHAGDQIIVRNRDGSWSHYAASGRIARTSTDGLYAKRDGSVVRRSGGSDEVLVGAGVTPKPVAKPGASNVRQLPTKTPAKPPVKAETPAERNRRLIAEEDARNAARNPNRERSTAELAGMSQAERDKYRNAMTMSLAGGGTPEQRRALKDQMDQADLVWSRNPTKPDAANVTPINAAAPKKAKPNTTDPASMPPSTLATKRAAYLEKVTALRKRSAAIKSLPDADLAQLRKALAKRKNPSAQAVLADTLGEMMRRGISLASTADAVELSAKTAFYSTHHHELGTPGGPGLWRHKGWQLPDYITNVAKGVMESGQLDKSKAIEIAVGKVRDWAEGKGNVSPEVRAAAAKAIAEWDAKRAATKATKLTAEPAQEIEMAKPMFGGKTPTAKDVRDMVSAHGKVPAPLRDKYRKRVIGHARKANAMHHIPPAWLKGSAAAKG